jgi:hypothetical protein
MKKIWKVIAIIALALLVLSAAVAAIGLFTGGSVNRMIEVLFGSRETFDMMVDILKQEIGKMF